MKASQNLLGIPPSVTSQLESSSTDIALNEVAIAGGLRQLSTSIEPAARLNVT